MWFVEVPRGGTCLTIPLSIYVYKRVCIDIFEIEGPNKIESVMTSSNGNISRVPGNLCGEFIGHRWIPPQRPVTRNFDFLICAWINGWVTNREAGDLRRQLAHYGVTLMLYNCYCIYNIPPCKPSESSKTTMAIFIHYISAKSYCH